MTKKEHEPHRQVPPVGRPATGQSAPSCVIATGHLNGTVRVGVVGEIDIAVHDRLRAALAAALCAGPAEVVVDLATTTFLDAGGISVLLHAQHEARRAGRHLRITNPQHPTVRQVLDITGTLGVLAEPGNAPDDEADDLEPLDEDEEHDRAR
jgi:anti-anti-sigma factor